ncbi:MAG: aldo/keto reductase [Deltaproteobacteria bacterium]|nr:aldo/keto reductase [Deltaproteobacteria bacterium]
MTTSRRGFLGSVGVGVSAVAVGACGKDRSETAATPPPAEPPPSPPKPAPSKNQAPALGDIPLAMKGPMPRRPLGKTGIEVSLLCLGGYHLGTLADEAAATRIVHEALDHGINFFDCAWEYHDGKSEEWLGKALAGRRDKAVVMTKVCSHGRDAKVAMQMLEDSLRRLATDVIDLWQIHEVIYDDDPARHYASDGVLTALDKARAAGKIRHVGFTGHKDPAIHLDMLERGYAFDACQLPLNCFDGAGFRSFEKQVLPVLAKRGIAALGMKSMGGQGESVKQGAVSAADALGYAMSLPIASLVTGVDSVAVLHQNLNLAGGFTAWPESAMQAVRDRVRAPSADGRFELFKTSKKYDGKPGREQHGFPPPDELDG